MSSSCFAADFTNADDLFKIATITFADAATLCFLSETGRVYTVEYTADFLTIPQVWNEFTNGIPGTGDLIHVDDTNQTSNRNYRVRVGIAPAP